MQGSLAELEARAYKLVEKAEKIAPGRVLVPPFFGIEDNQLFVSRLNLVAAGAAVKHRARERPYVPHDGRLGPDALRPVSEIPKPTGMRLRVDLERLHQLLPGLVLTSWEDPELSPRELQSLATKRSDTTGRPLKIDDKMAVEIFSAVDFIMVSDPSTYHANGAHPKTVWCPSQRELFPRFGVSERTISACSIGHRRGGLTGAQSSSSTPRNTDFTARAVVVGVPCS